MLFEVLLALSILTLGMATVGIQINAGLRLEAQAAETFRRTNLIESMLAHLEGLIVQAMSGAEQEEEGLVMPDRELEVEDEFGLVFPGYAYRILIEPTEVEDLNRVTIELLQADFDPETGELEGDLQQAYLVRTLRATPPRINLDTENGGPLLPQGMRGPLQELGLIDADGNLNIQKLLAMDPAALLELLPVLMSAFGGGQLGQMMGGMSPEQLLEALEQQQSGQRDTEAGGRADDGAATGPAEADAGPDSNLDDPPSFDELNPSGGLTQEQFEWMLQQLLDKQKGGR